MTKNDTNYYTFFINSPAAMLLIHPKTMEIIDANSSACSFYQYSHDEMLKLKISDINILSKEEIAFEMEQARSRGKKHFDFKHRLGNGQIRDVEVYSAPMMLNGDEILYSIIHDRTERKKAEEERLALALESTGDGVWDWNTITNEVVYSKRWKEMLGYQDEEISNSFDEWDKRLHPDDRNFVYQQLNRHLEGLTAIYQSEHRLLCKDGSYTWILSRGKVISWTADGKPLRATGTHKDITYRKQMETSLREAKEKAEKASITKSEFLANMSHELRTPLNVTLGAIQLFELYINNDLDLDKEKLLKHLKSMKQNSFRLLKLVNNLIDTNKIDSGFYEPIFYKYNIVNVIERIALSVSDYAKQKNINLIFESNEKEIPVVCDVDMIDRMMLNILSNAIKFTDDFIYVNISTKEDVVVITVKDNGIGIEQNKLKIIFERYRQAADLLTRENEGSGIGLSLTKSLVEMHGGKISVKSEYGKGCEFIIELPVKQKVTEEITLHPVQDICDHHKLIEMMNVEFSDIYK